MPGKFLKRRQSGAGECSPVRQGRRVRESFREFYRERRSGLEESHEADLQP